MPVVLVCPDCRTPLLGDDRLFCHSCNITYTVDGCIPVFEPEQVEYRDYEDWWAAGQSAEKTPRWRRIIFHHLRYWSYRERRFFEGSLKAGSLVLDIGCWGGDVAVAGLGGGTVVGIDLSLSALRQASHVYNLAIQGNIKKLPFADASFDYVISSHVLGHVMSEEKDSVLSEIFRVLKPGGESLHVIETDSGGKLVSRAKQQPDLYRQHFIDRYGHIGLESASTVIGRFQSQGFIVKKVIKMDSLWLPPWYYQQYFDNEYVRRDPLLARKLRRSRRLCSTRASRLALGFVWGWHHSTWEQWLGRLDDSMHIFIHVRKPDGNG
ncbi:MAG: methyltransferase domain-containing protein [Thermoleophilia bacterium]